MSDKPINSQNMVPTETDTPLQTSSSLFQRGLDDLDNRTLTLEDIRQARREHPELNGLTEEVVRLVLEQPLQWKAQILFQVIHDEIRKHQTYFDGCPQVDLESKEYVSIESVTDWTILQMNRLQTLLDRADTLFNDLITPLKSIKHPAGLKNIIAIALGVGVLYYDFMQWQEKVRKVNHAYELQGLIEALPQVIDPILQAMQEYAPTSLALIHEAISGVRGQNVALNLTLSFDLDQNALNKVSQELQNCRR
jgi:hypothetical protein